jgi:hypothetical protein
MQLRLTSRARCKPASLLVSTALPGALIANIGDGTPFLVGSQKTLKQVKGRGCPCLIMGSDVAWRADAYLRTCDRSGALVAFTN